MTTPELEINQEFSDLEDFTPSKISHKDEIETVIYSLEENDSAMVQKN